MRLTFGARVVSAAFGVVAFGGVAVGAAAPAAEAAGQPSVVRPAAVEQDVRGFPTAALDSKGEMQNITFGDFLLAGKRWNCVQGGVPVPSEVGDVATVGTHPVLAAAMWVKKLPAGLTAAELAKIPAGKTEVDLLAAAKSLLAREAYDDDKVLIKNGLDSLPNGLGAVIRKTADLLEAEAAKIAGPFTVKISNVPATAAEGKPTTGTAGLSVTSKSGQPIEGASFTATLSGTGKAKWNAPVTGAEWRGTTKAGEVTQGWTSQLAWPQTGKVQVKATVNGLPSTLLRSATATTTENGEKGQNLVGIAADSTAAGASAEVDASVPVIKVKPTVTTQISSQTAEEGDTIYDTVIGKGFPANAPVHGTVDLYCVAPGTKVIPGQKPADAKKLATVSFSGKADANGAFSIKSGTYTVTGDKCDIYAQEITPAGSFGGKSWDQVIGQFGAATEISRYKAPKPEQPKPEVPEQPVIPTDVVVLGGVGQAHWGLAV